jgi:hypothetical protein
LFNDPTQRGAIDTMTATLTVLHPGLEEAKGKDKPRLAARLSDLKGKRIALLDNCKVNADAILAAVAKRLQALGAGEVRAWKKPRGASSPGDTEIPLIQAWKPDAVLVALGD